MNPQQIAYGFAASAEREGMRVRGDYQKYLGRTPAQAEVDGWINAFVNHTASNEDVLAGFIQSPEYYRSHGGDARDWLFAAYNDALNRNPGQLETSYWLQLLGSN